MQPRARLHGGSAGKGVLLRGDRGCLSMTLILGLFRMALFPLL